MKAELELVPKALIAVHTCAVRAPRRKPRLGNEGSERAVPPGLSVLIPYLSRDDFRVWLFDRVTDKCVLNHNSEQFPTV